MNTPTRPRRLTRLIAAVLAFVATSAALHAVAHEQGWNIGRHGHHHAWQQERCDVTPSPGNGASKPAL